MTCNVFGTQRLLEAVRSAPSVRRVVFASSGSVYGATTAESAHEGLVPQPHSPYGATKLAAEHLCGMYAENFGVPTVALLYFYAYGPRQRPDVAVYRAIESALRGRRSRSSATARGVTSPMSATSWTRRCVPHPRTSSRPR
ncbi:NAD-dependent epimerase/dehydratase family protein [Actinophytocola sp.]|uniref:NAD-dependent epimerase/dehydratase family protein n=1 Tax=Actinophytocola sp. TaxID=1872138 RepID=UPI003D6B8566